MFIIRICFSTATPWKWFIDIRLETFYHQTEYYTIVFHTRFTSLPSLNVTLNIWFHYSIMHPKEDCYMYSLQSHKYNTVISDYNSLYKRKYLDMHQNRFDFCIFMLCPTFDVLSRNSRCHFCCLILPYVLNCVNFHMHMGFMKLKGHFLCGQNLAWKRRYPVFKTIPVGGYNNLQQCKYLDTFV